MQTTNKFAAVLIGFAISGSAGAAEFTAEGQKLAPVPTGHQVGKDNYATTSANRFHFGGQDCGICHAPGRKAGAHVFTMAGTMYTDRTGRKPLAGAEIILQDVTGNVISMTSNDSGNFATTAAIASDPAGWDSTLTDAENQANPGTWRYKAWVKSGDYVSPMVTIAPVGGMSTARMSCNMHHSPSGSRGANNVGGTSTLPTYPASGLSYAQHVQPILKNRCKACHMPSGAAPSTTYPTGVTYFYNGRLDLATYTAKDPATDKDITQMVNTSNPDMSPLLAKVVMGSPHVGGSFWKTTDPDYVALRTWIAEGAKNN